MDGSSADPPKKKHRRPSSLEKFVNKLPPGQKYRLDVNGEGQIIGPYKTAFKNFIGVVARTKISILPFSWGMMLMMRQRTWLGTMLSKHLKFPKMRNSKRNGCLICVVAGNSSRQDSTMSMSLAMGMQTVILLHVTSIAPYLPIHGLHILKVALLRSFWLREKLPRINKKKYIYRHTMGPGGYEKLKEDLKGEQIKKRKEESGDPNLHVEPRSPERHELWKAGRKTKSGSFVSEETASVASKIDELTVMSSQGSFVSQGKYDILTAAIGTPEHPGRTRGARKGVGLKKYFKSVHRSSRFNESQFMNKVNLMVAEKVQSLLGERSQTCGGLCPNVAVQVSKPMNTGTSKGSCSPSNAKEEEEEEEELEEKIDWLRKIHVISYDDTVDGDDKHVRLELEHEKHVWFISPKGLNDMVSGRGWLELAHLSLWCTYLFRQAIEKGDDQYGFLCLHKMNLKAGNITVQTVSEYIQ